MSARKIRQKAWSVFEKKNSLSWLWKIFCSTFSARPSVQKEPHALPSDFAKTLSIKPGGKAESFSENANIVGLGPVAFGIFHNRKFKDLGRISKKRIVDLYGLGIMEEYRLSG